MLQSKEFQRVRHDSAPEEQQPYPSEALHLHLLNSLSFLHSYEIPHLYHILNPYKFKGVSRVFIVLH